MKPMTEKKESQEDVKDKVIARMKTERLVAMTGQDTGRHFSVYYTFSDGKKLGSIRVDVPYSNPNLHSVAKHYPSAQFYEQEITEMFGVKFAGNTDAPLHTMGDAHHLKKG